MRLSWDFSHFSCVGLSKNFATPHKGRLLIQLLVFGCSTSDKTNIHKKIQQKCFFFNHFTNQTYQLSTVTQIVLVNY